MESDQLLKIAAASSVVVGLALLLGGGCSSQVGSASATCANFCDHISAFPCYSPSCRSECEQAEGQCASLGRAAAFQSLLDCAASAKYACQGDPPAPTTSGCSDQLHAVQGCGATLVHSPPPFPSFDAGPIFVPDASGDMGPPGEGGADGSPSDAGPLDAATDAPPDGDQACALPPDKLDCEFCCLNDHSEGSTTLLNAELACLCGDVGPCSDTCASEFCGGVPPTVGDACDTCIHDALVSGGICNAPVLDTCVMDLDCLELLACYDPCRTKP